MVRKTGPGYVNIRAQADDVKSIEDLCAYLNIAVRTKAIMRAVAEYPALASELETTKQALTKVSADYAEAMRAVDNINTGQERLGYLVHVWRRKQ